MNTYSIIINVKTTATPSVLVYENVVEVINADTLEDALTIIEDNLSLTETQEIEIVRINYVHQHKAIDE